MFNKARCSLIKSSINIQIRGVADKTYIQLLFVYNSYKQKCNLALDMYPICLLPNDSVEKSRISTLHGILVFISIDKGTNENIY